VVSDYTNGRDHAGSRAAVRAAIAAGARAVDARGGVAYTADLTSGQQDAAWELGQAMQSVLDVVDAGRPAAELERPWKWHEAAWDNYLAGPGVHPPSR
jgi:hypothetical protein